MLDFNNQIHNLTLPSLITIGKRDKEKVYQDADKRI